MFNPNKQDDLNDVKDKAANLANSVKTNVENTANEVKNNVRSEVDNLSNTMHEQTAETKAQAVSVIESLKSLLAHYTSSSNVAEIKTQILDKANQLKGLVKDEAGHVYEVTKDKATQTVQDKPIMTLAVAVGAGVLLGYILGSKSHSK